MYIYYIHITYTNTYNLTLYLYIYIDIIFISYMLCILYYTSKYIYVISFYKWYFKILL